MSRTDIFIYNRYVKKTMIPNHVSLSFYYKNEDTDLIGSLINADFT